MRAQWVCSYKRSSINQSKHSLHCFAALNYFVRLQAISCMYMVCKLFCSDVDDFMHVHSLQTILFGCWRFHTCIWSTNYFVRMLTISYVHTVYKLFCSAADDFMHVHGLQTILFGCWRFRTCTRGQLRKCKIKPPFVIMVSHVHDLQQEREEQQKTLDRLKASFWWGDKTVPEIVEACA